MVQYILTAIIVALSIAYAVYRIRQVMKGATNCCDGCKGCELCKSKPQPKGCNCKEKAQKTS